MNNRIAEERERLHWTQGHLARFLEVPLDHIEAWESDASHIPSTYALKMSDCFGCSIDFLFGLTEKRGDIGEAADT